MSWITGLIGDPVSHSRSPALHHAAFALYDIDGRYELWHTPSADLEARVQSLRAPGYLGSNVTLPHKLAVLPLLDRVEPHAALIGAVNTIIREEDGSLTGTNTDAPAFIEALRVDAAYEPSGQHVVVLGGSGAARAAVVALLGAEVASITLVNRTVERAESLLGDMLASTSYDPQLRALAPDAPDLADVFAEATLIVNATSLGWKEHETPLDATLIPPAALVYDMVYHQTRFLREAEARGARTCDGMGMLVRQAALAFARWTSKPPPVEAMWQAVGGRSRT